MAANIWIVASWGGKGLTFFSAGFFWWWGGGSASGHRREDCSRICSPLSPHLMLKLSHLKGNCATVVLTLKSTRERERERKGRETGESWRHIPCETATRMDFTALENKGVGGSS